MVELNHQPRREERLMTITTSGVLLTTDKRYLVDPCEDDMVALGFVDYGHVHLATDLRVRLHATRQVEPARLNPDYVYWIETDPSSPSFVLMSNLARGNALGTVEQFDGGELKPGEVYLIEHSVPEDDECGMVLRPSSMNEVREVRERVGR